MNHHMFMTAGKLQPVRAGAVALFVSSFGHGFLRIWTRRQAHALTHCHN